MEQELSAAVRRAVLDYLQDNDLTRAEDLAARLGAVQSMIELLLTREHWPLKTALAIADRLDITAEVTVRRLAQSA